MGDEKAAAIRAKVERDARRARTLMWSVLVIPLVAIVAYALWPSGGQDTPSACQSASDTPCLSTPGTVRFIDSGGSYRFEPLGAWRADKSEAEQDVGPAARYGPGPVAP